jgi:hypothetical protein
MNIMLLIILSTLINNKTKSDKLMIIMYVILLHTFIRIKYHGLVIK